jgi:hypothetical protein
MVKRKAPMQILNLILQKRHKNLFEGKFIEKDDYANWIQWVNVDENE